MTKEQATREALELALDALEEFGEHYDWCHQFPTYAFPENYPPCNCGYDEAITAIKEALSSPNGEAQRKPKESEQEPPVVAELLCVCGAEWEWRNRDWELVSTPPQRKPLNEQFIMDSTRELSTDVRWPSTFIDVWRLCEAAHGIKE